MVTSQETDCSELQLIQFADSYEDIGSHQGKVKLPCGLWCYYQSPTNTAGKLPFRNMVVFSSHGPQYSRPKVSRKLWVLLYFSLVLGFHNLKWQRALSGIAWPFYPFKALQLHLITAKANLLCVSSRPMYLCGISLHHTMAGVSLSASAVAKWPP